MTVSQTGSPRYRVVPHTADLAFEVEASDWPGLLAAASLAVSDLIRTVTPGGDEERGISVEGADREDVLVAFLAEVLYAYEHDGFLPSSAVVDRAGTTFAAGRITGARLDPAANPPDRVVKAVTYHDLKVVEGAAGAPWSVRVVLDL